MTPDFKDGLFREAWQEYETNVIPKQAGVNQRHMMRQSFLAGAFAYRHGMASAFVNDAKDGLAIDNLAALDADMDAMTLEFFETVRRLQVGMVTDVQEPVDAPLQTHMHVVEARGLAADEVDELHGIIKNYIATKAAEKTAH